MHAGLVSSTIMDWRSSALPLIVGLLGGVGAFLGPAVGALFFSFVQDELVARTVLWDLAIGIVVLGVILLAPRGLTGAIRWLITMLLALGDRALGRSPALVPAPGVAGAAALAAPLDGSRVASLVAESAGAVELTRSVPTPSRPAAAEPAVAHAGNGRNGKRTRRGRCSRSRGSPRDSAASSQSTA